MLNFVIVIVENGKRRAIPTQKNEHENLISMMEIPSIHAMHYVASKKRAIETAECWNEAYRKNGTLMQ